MALRANRRALTAAARAAVGTATPFYAFDPRAARDNARVWKREAAESDVFEVFYPYKCNRCSCVIELFARESLGAEVSTGPDLDSALALGIRGERLVVSGPAKTRRMLDHAIGSGAWLVADGERDAAAILERSRALGRRPRYLVRLRVAAAEPSQADFGFGAAEAVRLARALIHDRRPLPEGIAFHLGTGLEADAPYLGALRETASLSAALRSAGVPVRVVDVGGGFAARGEARRDSLGRPRRPPRSVPARVRELSRALRAAVPGARGFLEPGRALVSDAFHLVTRVVRVRGSRVYLDASRMSHAFFVPRGRHPFIAVPRRAGSRRRSIAGPLPSHLDLFSEGEAVGKPREGDILVIGSVGAYNLIQASAWAGPVPEVVEVGRRRR